MSVVPEATRVGTTNADGAAAGGGESLPGAGDRKKDLLRGSEGFDAQSAALTPTPAPPSQTRQAQVDPNAPPLVTPGETVLTREGKWMSADQLEVIRAGARKRIQPWGLGFDAAVFRLATEFPGRPSAVVVMRWDTSWGPTPSSPLPEPLSLAPLEASVACKAVHGMAGWPEVSGADQAILEPLLSGPTNAVSDATRKNLRGRFAGLSKKDAKSQAKALSGLIGASAALPDVVDERVDTTPVTYKCGAMRTEAKFAFDGIEAAAEITPVSFSDGTSTEIVAPAALKKGYHQHTVEEAAEAAAYLPEASRKALTQIVLNPITNPEDPAWAVEYKTPSFHSYMAAGAAGVVTIYPDKKKEQPGANYRRGTMIHETGHSWSYQTWGEDETAGGWLRWKAAMDKDRVSVSGYAQNAIAEDVAETIQVYGSTKGSPKYEEYKKLVPTRLGILEKEMK